MMDQQLTIPIRPSKRGERLWEIVDLLPAQGEWSEEEYLALNTKQLVEFTDGMIEVLPMPTVFHQLIAMWLCNSLNNHRINGERAGLSIIATFKLKIRERKYREPDVLFMKRENLHRVKNEMWDYADFVIEVVSEGGEHRDYVEKVQAYAEAGVPEYWIADPATRRVKQLVLEGLQYKEIGDFEGASKVVSKTVDGFEVVAGELFDHAQREMKLQNE